jgi:hypothetical protein
MQYHRQMTLDGRLRALLTEVKHGSFSVEEAALLLRAEVVASFMRGHESGKRAPHRGRSPYTS